MLEERAGGIIEAATRKKNKEDAISAMSEDDVRLTSEQTYDSALSAMVTKLPRFIIPFVNEVFGEGFTDEAEISIKTNKHVVQEHDGALRRRETDAFVEVSETLGGRMVRKFYHFECETWYDKGIVLRIAEYASIISVETVEVTEDGVILPYPDSVVVFLRPDKSIPKVMKVTLRVPDGRELTYEVPVIRIWEYTVDVIFEKKLLIMLPFYLFSFMDELDEMERDAEKRKKIDGVLSEISQGLAGMVRDGEINTYQQRTVLRLLIRVSNKLLIKHRAVRRRVDDIMSGYILRTDADDILEQGMEQGIEQGENNLLITKICLKMRKGKIVSQIADELEEDESRIEGICEMASSFAPDYDAQKVIQFIMKKEDDGQDY